MQFNNWNEDRKQKKREMDLLSSIYLDITASILEVKQNVEDFDSYFISPMNLLDSCLHCKRLDDFDRYSEKLWIPTGCIFLNMNNGAYECFKYEGSTLIKNNYLKIKLFDYYESRLNWINVQERMLQQYADLFVIPVSHEYLRVENKMPKETFLNLRKDKKSRKILKQWKYSYKELQQLHRDLIPLLVDIKKVIEDEFLVSGIDPKQILKEAKSTIS